MLICLDHGATASSGVCDVCGGGLVDEISVSEFPGLVAALVELKHSIRIYLSLAGNKTADLAIVSAKLIDCLCDTCQRKNPAATVRSLACLPITLLSRSIRLRLTMAIASNHKLSSTLRVFDTLISDCNGRDPIADKYRNLQAIVMALDALDSAFDGKMKYPPILDIKGKPL